MTARLSETAHHPSLLEMLAWKRRHVKTAVEGLSDHDKSTTHVPSGWTPLNLLRHLSIDVEMFWISAVMAGDPNAVRYFTKIGRSGWDAPITGDPGRILDDYAAETVRSDEVIMRLAPHATPRWWPSDIVDAPPRDLTHVLLHVLVDTATHAGQLDIVRERIDGTQFLVVQ